jgi:hypothetical protein
MASVVAGVTQITSYDFFYMERSPLSWKEVVSTIAASSRRLMFYRWYRIGAPEDQALEYRSARSFPLDERE